MEHRMLGQTGLRVPVIGMGTWRTFAVRGGEMKKNARALVDMNGQRIMKFSVDGLDAC